MLDVVIPKAAMSRVAYLICLDVSKPHTVVEQYNKWMGMIEETQKRLLGRLTQFEQRDLQTKGMIILSLALLAHFF